MSSVLPVLQVIYNDLAAVSAGIHKSYMGTVDSLAGNALTALVAKHGGINVAINALDAAAKWLNANEGSPLPTSFISPPPPPNESQPVEDNSYASGEVIHG
jgi:hypothetical protein